MVIYLDSADLQEIVNWRKLVDGFTTNPTLWKKAGAYDYRAFSDAAIFRCAGKPISFEVFADDLVEMEAQAREIASWGSNVYVKIPVTNTKGESTASLVRKLSLDNIKVNVTAVFTLEQINTVARSLFSPSILSIFCGRIADSGIDPVPFITHALRVKHSETKILWASTRELYNLKQAREAGADIITVSPDLLSKMHLIGKDLTQYSLETVTQFYNDAKGLSL